MKTMKSTMARLFALCLTVAMVLSMATMGAFAASITSADQTGTITINSAASDNGAKVDLYKVMDVNMVNVGTEQKPVFQPQDPMYTWVDAVATWLETNANETYKGYINADNNAVTDSFKEATAAELSKFISDLKTAVTELVQPENPEEEAKPELELKAAHQVTLASTTQVIENVEMGYYLVVANKSAYVYSPATVTFAPVWDKELKEWVLNDAAVTVKGKGGIEKDVVGGDLGHTVGDTVTYRLDVVIPTYPEAGPGETVYATFKVGDTMGTGLDFGGIEKVKVYANNSANSYEDGDLVGASDLIYTIAAQGNGFEIDFNYDAVKTAVSGCTYVHVEYTATLNENAFEEDALGNDAYLGVNTDPYDEDSYEKTIVEKDVYTYGINATKVDANDGAALLGAEFKLYSDDKLENEIRFVGSEGSYTKAEDQESEGVTLRTNGLGQIILGGLDTGTYYLKEVKAPDGYQLPKDEDAVTTIVIEDTAVGDDGVDGILDSGTATGSMVEQGATATSGNTISFKLMNTKPGFELPTTGGMGTVLFTAGGLVIMACGAALVLVTLKKKKAED